MFDCVRLDIETLEIENGSSKKSQTTITFDSDVRYSLVIYRGALIENRSSEQIQTTITFYSDVRLSPVGYRDAHN